MHGLPRPARHHQADPGRPAGGAVDLQGPVEDGQPAGDAGQPALGVEVGRPTRNDSASNAILRLLRTDPREVAKVVLDRAPLLFQAEFVELNVATIRQVPGDCSVPKS